VEKVGTTVHIIAKHNQLHNVLHGHPQKDSAEQQKVPNKEAAITASKFVLNVAPTCVNPALD